MSRLAVQRAAVIAALTLALSGCSILEEDKIDYKSAAKAPTLEIPPDLSQLRKDSRYAIESNSATASGFNSASARVADAGTATNNLGDVRMERQGNQRWLVVARPADKVWEPLKEFWTSNGFILITDSPDVGIMETDWAENRAKIPQDIIRKTLGKVLDSLYSSGERDKFRTRVERNAQGGVEIYITHRGMVENYTSAQKESTIWQPRASDAELEIEFLRRLMVKLGATPEAAKTANTGPTVAGASVSTLNGQPAIELNDTLDRAWRRTGVALDRTGFTVEDRDRTQGVYFVRYITPGSATDKEPGFFAKLFSSKTDPVPLSRYRIALSDKGNGNSIIRVLDANGQTETSGNAERILKLLANELR